jgi:hypothetical protein
MQNSFLASASTEYTEYTEWQWPLSGVHPIKMVKSAEADGGGSALDFLGPNCTRFACSHFRAQKSLDFQGPPLQYIS